MERKKKNEQKTKVKKKPTPLESTYFRLCHFCFHLNEADQPILDCTQCANLLSSEPIEEFYEDVYEQLKLQKADAPEEDEDEAPRPGSMLPNPELRGLSVIW